MGESKLKRSRAEEMLLSCTGVQTAGGRVQVRWDADGAATPMGQLAYFIEFLTLTGLWRSWQDRSPLSYTSPNAPGKADVLGTWMLSILSGHRRYSHVTTIRCDGVNPGLLGMNKVISEDALRRALLAIPEEAGVGTHGQLRAADLIVIGVPVYKASYPGAFKHFLDLLDPKALEGKSAILVATGGSDQHALILEHQLRALTSYLGLYSAPKTLFARDTDFSDYRLASPAIAERVALVAGQARRLLRTPAAQGLAEAA